MDRCRRRKFLLNCRHRCPRLRDLLLEFREISLDTAPGLAPSKTQPQLQFLSLSHKEHVSDERAPSPRVDTTCRRVPAATPHRWRREWCANLLLWQRGTTRERGSLL